MDALVAWRRAVKAGEGTAVEASPRLARSPHGVGVGLEPGCKRMRAVEVGERTRARAQRLGPQGTQVLAPAGLPLLLTDGLRESLTALVTHSGGWMPPERRQAPGPRPPPRWRPRPQRLYAQVGTSSRRRGRVGGTHRVGCGTREAIERRLATRGGKSNTRFIARLNLDIRQQGAALGRRGNTLCTHDAGLRHPLTLFQTEQNVVLPHASGRVPRPAARHAAGTVTRWQPQTPGMAAGVTAHVWSLRAGWRDRVPPWPQPQGREGRGERAARAPQREKRGDSLRERVE
jgi:hypothetical protein